MSETASRRIRELILQIAALGQEGHIASSFSIVEILIASLGAGWSTGPTQIASVNEALNSFVLSKGHAALALYAFMVDTGVLAMTDFQDFAEMGSAYGGHPTRMGHPPILASTGSLGHGLPLCAGRAFAARLAGDGRQFICLCGDGEINEGSIWESLLLIGKFQLGNLTLIVDNNGSSTRAIDLGSIKQKLTSFGLTTMEVDGHDIVALRKALEYCRHLPGPAAVVANTIKGRGSTVTAGSFMWHHKVPNERDMAEIRNGFDI